MEYYSATRNNDFMKLMGKWMVLENIILSEVAPSQKKCTWYALTDKWILAQKLRIHKIQLTDMKLKKKEDQNVNASVLLRRVNKNSYGRKYVDKEWSRG